MAQPAYYGRFAVAYDVFARHILPLRDARSRLASSLTEADRSEAARFVEVGCGTGANLRFLFEAHPGAYVLGFDLNAAMLGRARSVASRENRRVELARADAARLPVQKGVADGVCASFVLGVLPEPASAVRAWCDLVKPGGRIALLDAYEAEDAGFAGKGLRAFLAATRQTLPSGRADEASRRLRERNEAGRAVLRERGIRVREERSLGGLLHLTVAQL